MADPAYVRCTTEADGVCLCTMYDVRCTIWIIARVARGILRSFSEGGGRRQTGSAYVRGTRYDVRLPNSRALRGGGGG